MYYIKLFYIQISYIYTWNRYALCFARHSGEFADSHNCTGTMQLSAHGLLLGRATCYIWLRWSHELLNDAGFWSFNDHFWQKLMRTSRGMGTVYPRMGPYGKHVAMGGSHIPWKTTEGSCPRLRPSQPRCTTNMAMDLPYFGGMNPYLPAIGFTKGSLGFDP